MVRCGEHESKAWGSHGHGRIGFLSRALRPVHLSVCVRVCRWLKFPHTQVYALPRANLSCPITGGGLSPSFLPRRVTHSNPSVGHHFFLALFEMDLIHFFAQLLKQLFLVYH